MDQQLFEPWPLLVGDIDVGVIRGWMEHSGRFFPRCLASEDIPCDVDEPLWLDTAVRQDAA